MSQFTLTLIAIVLLSCTGLSAEPLPAEHPLWQSDHQNTILYPYGELVRSSKVAETSPSGSNRVFSDVGVPTYFIHRPIPSKANGVGLVICPGGGYTDVWLDREGHDLAIWLKQFGITSLVLKYRTNTSLAADGRAYPWPKYLPAVTADAQQAVRTLRERANELKLDPAKIGISGFSAGGNLAMLAVFTKEDAGAKDESGAKISGHADFAGLFYPWLRTDDYPSLIEKARGQIPPLFIMNAADDNVTPAKRCLDFYAKLLAHDIKPELHIVSKGGHGFDLGEGSGHSAARWKQSFVAWLKDTQFIPSH